MSSVLKALKKAEKEKTKASAPVINSFFKRTEKKKLTYSFIRTGLFGVLFLSFLCSIFYLYNFNKKKAGKAKQIGSSIYFKQEQSKTKPIEFSNKSNIKTTSNSQKPNISERKTADVSINQIQEKPAPKTNTKKAATPESLPEPEPEEETAEFGNTVATEKASKPKIKLNMISWTHDPNERVTIINDNPMKEGETKDDIKVLKINIKNVHILHNNVKKVIKFKKTKNSVF